MPATPLLLAPFADRAGRFSGLKTATFALCLLPALWIAWKAGTGGLGPRPWNQAVHETGTWAVRVLMLSLAVTPARRILDWPRLILVRRMLGLFALAYVGVHLVLYAGDQNFDLANVASEIVLRVYLAIGFVALLGLLALGLTSTDAMIRRMGAAWNRLHKLVYPIAVLALVHHFLQAKVDVGPAVLMAGAFVLLMAYRVLQKSAVGLTPLAIAGAGILAGVLTGMIEVGWYALFTGVPADRVLAANLDPAMMRPAWIVGAAGLAVALAAFVRRKPQGERRGRPAVAR